MNDYPIDIVIFLVYIEILILQVAGALDISQIGDH